MAATRRDLLRRGLTVGAAAAATGGASAALAGGALAATPPAEVEARALGRALEIEQLLVVAYHRVLGTGLLRPLVKKQLQTHLSQELQHLAALQRAASARGMIVPGPPSLPAAQAELSRHEIHWSLTRLRNQHDALKLLVDIESLAENAYFEVVEKVQDQTLVGTCAEIMGCEAQHWTVLSGFLNHQQAKKAVPYPFVEGTP